MKTVLHADDDHDHAPHLLREVGRFVDVRGSPTSSGSWCRIDGCMFSIDDSGDGGFKVGEGSTSHLIMAACVFRDPRQIEVALRSNTAVLCEVAE